MLTYQLYVKGSEAVARTEAEQRGFTVTGARLYNGGVILDGETRDSLAPYKWLGEAPLAAPFPEGTLLYFQ